MSGKEQKGKREEGSTADPLYISAIVLRMDEFLEIAQENCFATQ